MAVRAAAVRDLGALMELERQCDGAPHWSQAAWQGVFESDAVERAVLVEVDGQQSLRGYVVVSIVAGVAEIESIAVTATARRQGVARGLCERAAEWALQRGAEAMQLEVRAGNAAALGLYRAMGFSEQGRRGRYYSDPVEEAVMMSLPLDVRLDKA